MLHIAAQLVNILLLLALVADNYRAIAHRRFRRRTGMPLVVRAHQQVVRHVTQELAADVAALLFGIVTVAVPRRGQQPELIIRPAK